MPTPILHLDGVVVVTLVEPLDDSALASLRAAVSEQIGRSRAHGLILDVSALDVMDSFATRTLLEIARVASLRGAGTVVVGIQPEVAFAMVQLGLDLEGVATALDLADGIALVSERRAQHGG